MPINTNSLGAGKTPEMTDGRRYPRYLAPYERYDREILEQLQGLQRPTINELAVSFTDPQVRSAVSPWLASAEWRDLISRIDDEAMVGNRRYELSARGRERLTELG